MEKEKGKSARSGIAGQSHVTGPPDLFGHVENRLGDQDWLILRDGVATVGRDDVPAMGRLGQISLQSGPVGTEPPREAVASADDRYRDVRKARRRVAELVG